MYQRIVSAIGIVTGRSHWPQVGVGAVHIGAEVGALVGHHVVRKQRCECMEKLPGIADAKPVTPWAPPLALVLQLPRRTARAGSGEADGLVSRQFNRAATYVQHAEPGLSEAV